MKRRQLNIVQLYPEQMNLYGDYGNAQIICRRVELYGYQAKLIRALILRIPLSICTDLITSVNPCVTC